MTREEAIKILVRAQRGLIATAFSEYEHKMIEALEMALSALRGPTREQVEKVSPGCDFCNLADFGEFGFEITKHYAKICCALGSWRFPQNERFLFCPKCGKPLTDEAVDILVKRLEDIGRAKENLC